MNENPEELSTGEVDPLGYAKNPVTGDSIPNPESESAESESGTCVSNDENSARTDIIEGDQVTVAAQPDNNFSGKSSISSLPPPVAVDLEGIAANGGAVGSMVLGIWSILGSLLTYWSMINGVLGLVLGIWGLTSRRPVLAGIGIGLSVLGCFLSMISISEMVSQFWNAGGEEF